MPATKYAEKKFVEAGLGIASLTTPTELYIALCEVAQNRTLTGTTIKEELTYEGYARVKLELAEYEITEGTESEPTKWVNKKAIALKLNTNTTGRKKAAYFAICDALTLGNMWFYGTLAESLEITKAITKLEIEAKKLEVTCE